MHVQDLVCNVKGFAIYVGWEFTLLEFRAGSLNSRKALLSLGQNRIGYLYYNGVISSFLQANFFMYPPA